MSKIHFKLLPLAAFGNGTLRLRSLCSARQSRAARAPRGIGGLWTLFGMHRAALLAVHGTGMQETSTDVCSLTALPGCPAADRTSSAPVPTALCAAELAQGA